MDTAPAGIWHSRIIDRSLMLACRLTFAWHPPPRSYRYITRYRNVYLSLYSATSRCLSYSAVMRANGS